MIEKDGPKVKVMIISQDKGFLQRLKDQLNQHNRFLYSYRKPFTKKGTARKRPTFEQAKIYVEDHMPFIYQKNYLVYYDIVGEYETVKEASLHYTLDEAYIVFIDEDVLNQDKTDTGELAITSLFRIGYDEERRLSNASLSWMPLGSEGWKTMLSYTKSVFEKQITRGFSIEGDYWGK